MNLIPIFGAAIAAIISIQPARSEDGVSHNSGAQSQAAVDGLRDRTALENWINGLNGDFRMGAFYWIAHRSVPKEAVCTGAGLTREGCLAAKERLDPFDVRRKAEPDYKLGWNAYQKQGSSPVTSTASVDKRQVTSGLGTKIGQANAALRNLKLAQQKLDAAREDASLAFSKLVGLRRLVRSALGCAMSFSIADADEDCLQTIPSSLVSRDEHVRDYSMFLFHAEVLPAIIEEVNKLESNQFDLTYHILERVTTLIESNTVSPNFLELSRKASEDVALLGESSAKHWSSYSHDTENFIEVLQILFHGGLIDVTQPGHQAATELAEAVKLAEQAEDEMDDFSATFSIPSGHVLINTPN